MTKRKEIREFLEESNAIEGVYGKAALKQALLAWDFLMCHNSLTKRVILKTHAILMKDTDLEPKYIGKYRDCRVWVGGHEGLPSGDIEKEIKKWMYRTQESRIRVDSKDLHVQFEKIHPFVDGNGRIGRMLMNWTRIMINEEDILILRANQRGEYYKWFKDPLDYLKLLQDI